MWVTQKPAYETYIKNMLRQQDEIYRLHKQLSSQKKVNAPSDDPVNAHNLLTSKTLLSRFEQFDRNIGYGKSHLGMAEQALDSAKDVIIRLQELAVTAASGTSTADTRNNIKAEVDILFDELVSVGNTNYDGRYIFSGFESGTPAFDQTGAYQGDANVQSIRVSLSSSVAIGTNGGEVFSGTSGGIDIMAAVAAFSTALGANDSAGIQTALGDLETSFNQVSNAVSDIGGRVSRLNAAEKDISVYSFELKSTISGIEDVDMAELVTDLKAGEVAMEAALASAGRIFQLSIFDYL